MPWALIGLRVVLRDTDETEPPLPRLRPALTLQTGQAPGPWDARTFWAMAIWAPLLARSAREAYARPPKPAQVWLVNCRPP